MQIGRIFRTLEKNVEVIYLSSVPVPEAIIKYYYKVLELVGVPNARRRVHFLVPLGVEKLPPYLSIAAKRLYSRQTVSRI